MLQSGATPAAKHIAAAPRPTGPRLRLRLAEQVAIPNVALPLSSRRVTRPGGRIEGVGAACELELPLEVADARKRRLAAILMPGLLGRFQRPLKSDVPIMHREGVAPAILHLGAPGVGLSKSIALVRNGPFDKGQNLADIGFVQVGSKGFRVK